MHQRLPDRLNNAVARTCNSCNTRLFPLVRCFLGLCSSLSLSLFRSLPAGLSVRMSPSPRAGVFGLSVSARTIAYVCSASLLLGRMLQGFSRIALGQKSLKQASNVTACTQN